MDATQELQQLERELAACHLHGVREYLDMADMLDQTADQGGVMGATPASLRDAAARVRACGKRYLEAHRCQAS
jgi:hypothetical protein